MGASPGGEGLLTCRNLNTVCPPVRGQGLDEVQQVTSPDPNAGPVAGRC
jgi:hypothetical protein